MNTMDLLRRSTVPEGRSGDWRVERFEIDEMGARLANLRMTFQGHGYRAVQPGVFTRLVRGKPPGGTTVMSDTRAELMDHYEPISMAAGNVLINGLGLGIVAQACLRKSEVSSVTVIEQSPDVINLVVPHIANDRLAVIRADALTWNPPKGSRYAMVWHDIWDNICSDNLEQMKLLHRRYGRRTDWQGSWCRDECEDARRIGY